MSELHPISDEQLGVLEQVIPKLAGIARSTGSNWIFEDLRKARRVLSEVRWPDAIWHEEEPHLEFCGCMECVGPVMPPREGEA